MTDLSFYMLGLLQGITEFLPVSSSGHLAVLQEITHFPENLRLPLDTFLHLATLSAVVTYFFNDIKSIILSIIADIKSTKSSEKFTDKIRKQGWHECIIIFIGSIPAGLAGVFLYSWFESLTSKVLVGTCFIITSLFLIKADKLKEGNKKLSGITYRDAIIIGMAQAVAILPGISRSGLTLFASLYVGCEKETALKFSFLLAIPAILGAGILGWNGLYGIPVKPLLVSGLIAFIAGLASLVFLKFILREKKLSAFGIYCLLAAAVTFLVI